MLLNGICLSIRRNGFRDSRSEEVTNVKSFKGCDGLVQKLDDDEDVQVLCWRLSWGQNLNADTLMD